MHVRLVSNYACRTADTVVSSDVAITVVPMVMPTVSIVAHPGTTISLGQSDTLVAIPSSAGPTPTYQWSVNGINVPGATSAIFVSNIFANGDIVTVRITSSGACGGLIATASVTISVGTGVDQVVKGDLKLMLSPNPNKGAFTVKGTIGTTDDREAIMLVTDMLGQVVYENRITVKDGKVNERINLNNTLANGMYLFQFGMGEEKIAFHFVIGQ